MWREMRTNNRKPWAWRWGSPFPPVPRFLLVAGVRKLLLFTLFLFSFVFLIKLLITSYFHLTCHIRMWSPPLAALTETIECRIQSEGATGQYRLVFEGVLVFAAVLIYVMFNLRDPSQSQLPTWWGPLSRRGGGSVYFVFESLLVFLAVLCVSWDPQWQRSQPGGVRWAGEGRWAALHILQGWARAVPRIMKVCR